MKNNFSLFLRKFGLWVLFFYIITFLTDEFLTFIAVKLTCEFYETNVYVVWLWATFGYWGGEIISLSLKFALIVYPIYKMLISKNGWIVFAGFCLVCICFGIWLSAVIHNYVLLYQYFL